LEADRHRRIGQLGVVQITGGAERVALGRSISGEGYVRLRVRYDRGELSIVGAQEVDGPLVQPRRLREGFVYEVRHGSRRISAETIPDLGVQRSFPPPEGEETEEIQGHHITELETCEFNVRIPANEFSRRSLRYLRIVLCETVETPEVRRMDARPLDAQFERVLRSIGQLKGIRMGDLPEDVQRQVDEASRQDLLSYETRKLSAPAFSLWAV
jgi:hypothetical protein